MLLAAVAQSVQVGVAFVLFKVHVMRSGSGAADASQQQPGKENASGQCREMLQDIHSKSFFSCVS